MEDENIKTELSNGQQPVKKSTTKIFLIIVTFLFFALSAVLIVTLLLQKNSPTHTHSFDEWKIEIPATHLSQGSKTRYCSCGESQTVFIDKLQHEYGTWKTEKESTCSVAGTQIRSCECGETEEKTLPLANHEYGSWTLYTKSTCTKSGKNIRYCECGSSQTQETEKTPHDFISKIIVKASSKKAGTIEKSCSSCTYSITETYVLTEKTSEEIYKIAESCVGEIITKDKSGNEKSLGTVFAISSDGKLVTNYHVIDMAYSASIKINGKTYNVVQILAYDKDIDLAVLKINASGLTALDIQTDNINGGSTVYAVGSSEGYTLSFSTGVIASPNRVFDGVNYIQHEAAISHGNSGGPLFNSYGEVIGINTLTNIEGQNLNFAINAKELDNLVYGEALSFSDFYEAECDPFTRIMDYIISYGSYDSEDCEYDLYLDSSYSNDGSEYARYIYYDMVENIITFALLIDSDYFVTFEITPALNGHYSWAYIDYADNYMSGTIIASTYTSDSLLGYSYNNIYYSSLRTSVRKLSSSMINVLCASIDQDLSDIGVTAYDLGFYYY